MQDTATVRNVALFGHGKCGKTSLAEALLFTAGKTTRLGKVDDGSSSMDFEPEELKRKVSISSAFNQFTWKKHSVFLIDTPGDDNFINDTIFTAKIAECAIFVVEANMGIKFQTEKIAGFVADQHLPTILFINKMDRDRADFDTVLAEIKKSLPFKPVVLYLPIGAEAGFKGVVDIIRNKALLFDKSGKIKEADVPADLADAVAAGRETLMETVAETDDQLIEKFLEEGELGDEDLRIGLAKGTKAGLIHPVCIGSAFENLGTEVLLNTINDLMPCPADRPARLGTDPKTKKQIERRPLAGEPFSALVFKTMADPYAGRLTIFKVISGTLTSDTFYNPGKDVMEKFGQVLILEGKGNKPTQELFPGMIGAVSKLKETVTGDTLCAKEAPILFELPLPINPVMSFAVSTTKKDEEDKLFSSITKMLEEDPTLRLSREPQTREILLSGVGQVHLEVISEKIKRKFGVEMSLRSPKVPYMETIKGKARVQGKHKKQSGGRGQFADSWVEIEPMPRGGSIMRRCGPKK